MAAGLPDGVADAVIDELDRTGEVGVEGIVGTQLTVDTGPWAAVPRCARHRDVRLGIDRVRRGLPPLQADRAHQCQFLHGLHGQRRFQMDQVGVAGEAGEREVEAVGKQRIEGAELAVAGTAVAGRRIGLQPEPRHPRHVLQGVARAGAECPGADLAAADMAGLPHAFEVPVDGAELAGEADVEHVAVFVAESVEILRAVALIQRIVGRQLVGAEHLPLQAQGREAEVPVGDIVERREVVVLHRLADEADEAPGAALPVPPDRIERLPHIGAVARRHEALQVEGEVLPADARLERARIGGVGVGNESKAQVERILVDRRDDILVEGARVFELGEDLPVLVEADVGVDLQALDQVGIRHRMAGAEAGSIAGLEPLAQGHPQRDVAVRIARQQRDVFQAVERLGAQRRIGEHRPVLLPAIAQDRGAGGDGCVVGAGVLCRYEICKQRCNQPQCSLSRHGRACPQRPGYGEPPPHARLSRCGAVKTWMPGMKPGMTVEGVEAHWASQHCWPGI